jgi:hypothetical protein
MSFRSALSAKRFILFTAALLAISFDAMTASAEVSGNGPVTCRPGSSCTAPIPIIAAPDGWVQGRLNYGITALVRNGERFGETKVFMMAQARPKPAERSLADDMAMEQKGATIGEPGTRIIHLPKLQRADGKEPFHLFLSETPQSIRLHAETVDTDRLGNAYFAYIWLLADTPEEFNATLPHYEALLRTY